MEGGAYDGTGNYDTFVSIESITGSAFSDMIRGNDTANALRGNDGHDTLSGYGGADKLQGDGGNDQLGGGDGNDTLNGGSGGDTLNGGNGTDTADYSTAPANNFSFTTNGVSVDLSTGLGWFGDAEGDTLSSIENVRGSAFNDFLTGDGNANVLIGNGGNDTVVGGAGADTLDGGTGADTLHYWGSSAGVNIDLRQNLANGGHATGDSIVNFDSVIASEYSDTLTGNGGDNWLGGNGGADFIVGDGGRDMLMGGGANDTLIGGDDADLFYFTNYFSAQGHDVIRDFVVGTDHLGFLVLNENGLVGLDDLQFSQSGQDTVIAYDDGTGSASITLQGVDLNQLLAHADTDILFG
jgi:Ca2+-binding RTX toxin-like protein